MVGVENALMMSLDRLDICISLLSIGMDGFSIEHSRFWNGKKTNETEQDKPITCEKHISHNNACHISPA